jgi:DNA-binding transcriptional MocR family regulator
MTNWLPRLDDWRGPRYLAIADALARDVRSGRLRPGERLPPQRLLADLLGVHLSTVTRAYREAARRGLISGATRRGTLVLDKLHAAALFAPQTDGAAGAIDLRTNVPAAFPFDAGFERLVADVLTDDGLSSLIRYRSDDEWRVLHAEAAEWLTMSGLDADAFSLLLCAGAQHALDLALTCCGERIIAAEDWTWPGLKTVAAARGLQLVPLQLDGQGITPAALEQAARAGVRVAVLSPTLQNPTGASMGPARRAAIADIARRYRMWLVEEDVYGLLPAGRMPPLAALLPERVLYLTSLSKTVAPGLRLGFLALPHSLAAEAGSLLHLSAWYLSPLCVKIACRMMASGLASARLDWQRRELVARNRVLDTALGLHAGVDNACPHRWLPLPASLSAARALASLRADGFILLDGTELAVDPYAGHGGALRLALGAAPGRAELARVGAVLRTLLGTAD